MNKEDAKTKRIQNYFEDLISKNPYKDFPISTNMDSTELKRVKEHNKVSPDMLDEVEEVVEILERRERSL
ncbi:MAG: hypothetical protein P1P90_00335 [Patescibacteria group bacterium]|nr:hypothetical protein [Patescibacteria group bacterium]